VWLAAWAALIAAAFGMGALLRRAGALPVDPLPPLHAHARLLIGPLVPAAVAAVAAVVLLPVAARRLPWWSLLGAAWLGSAVWAVLLQLPDGIGRPLTAPTEYLGGLPAMGDDPLGWLRGFTRHLQEYPTHVKGHPPLPMLILWTTQWTGLKGAGWAAALVIAAGSSGAAAITVTVRAVTDERTARRAVPFLVLAPTAIWVATSMDALFLGVAAWGVAWLAVGASHLGPLPPGGSIPLQSSRPVDDRGKRIHNLWITLSSVGAGHVSPGGLPRPVAVISTFASGLLLGSLPYLSYGLLSIFALPLAVLILTRPSRPVVLALVTGCLVAPVAFALGGFSWWDGMTATHAAWAAGEGSRRPYAYFFAGDLAALALLIGPAAAQALPSVLRRAVALVRVPPTRLEQGEGHPQIGRLGVLGAAALLGVLALDLSGVTRGEVERIWLPYAAWMTAAAAAHRAPARALLVAQAVTALLLQALVRSPW
jgi:hypothetical protein